MKPQAKAMDGYGNRAGIWPLVQLPVCRARQMVVWHLSHRVTTNLNRRASCKSISIYLSTYLNHILRACLITYSPAFQSSQQTVLVRSDGPWNSNRSLKIAVFGFGVSMFRSKCKLCSQAYLPTPGARPDAHEDKRTPPLSLVAVYHDGHPCVHRSSWPRGTWCLLLWYHHRKKDQQFSSSLWKSIDNWRLGLHTDRPR